MKKTIQLAIFVPGIIIAALLASRLLMEIWNEIAFLSGERLTGYFALCFLSTAIWMGLSLVFVDMVTKEKR